ncbi:hypothetical protein GC169_00255 [bacterium]|nr:hypothetical protein [bacterium]
MAYPFAYPLGDIVSRAALAEVCDARLAGLRREQIGPKLCLAVWPTGEGFEMIRAEGDCTGLASRSAPGFSVIVLAPDATELQRFSGDLWRAEEIAYGVVPARMAPFGLAFLTEASASGPGRWKSFVFDPEAQRFREDDYAGDGPAGSMRAAAAFISARFCVGEARSSSLRARQQD